MIVLDLKKKQIKNLKEINYLNNNGLGCVSLNSTIKCATVYWTQLVTLAKFVDCK